MKSFNCANLITRTCKNYYHAKDISVSERKKLIDDVFRSFHLMEKICLVLGGVSVKV